MSYANLFESIVISSAFCRVS